MTNRNTAVVIGAEPGLGQALVDRFAQAGMQVAMVARSLSSGKALSSTNVRSYPCDATEPQAVKVLLTNQEPEKDGELKQKALDSWKWVNDFLVKHNPDGTYLFDEPNLADYAYGPFFQRWKIVEYYPIRFS